MKVEMSVTFEKEEIGEVLKEAYRKSFSVPVGYSLEARDRYGEWEVSLAKDVEPKPVKEEVTTDGK